MAARTFIALTGNDFEDLALELARMSEAAKQCAVIISQKGVDYRTDGMKNTVDGLESLTKVLGGILGVYNCEPPDLKSIREKLVAESTQKGNKPSEQETADSNMSSMKKKLLEKRAAKKKT